MNDSGLARHQLNPTRQGDHLQLLTGAQAKLLAHPLRDDDLVLGGYAYKIHQRTAAQKRDRSTRRTPALVGRYGADLADAALWLMHGEAWKETWLYRR